MFVYAGQWRTPNSTRTARTRSSTAPRSRRPRRARRAVALTVHDGVYGSLEFAHAAKRLGVRRGGGDARGRLPCDAARRERDRVREPLPAARPAAHAHTRDTTNREPTPPCLDQALEELNDGLVCLSGCARAKTPSRCATRTRRYGLRAPSAASVSTSSCSARTSAATRAATRRLRELADTIGVSTVRDRGTFTRTSTAGELRCRTSSSPSTAAPRSRAANRSGAEPRGGSPDARFPDDRDMHRERARRAPR